MKLTLQHELADLGVKVRALGLAERPSGGKAADKLEARLKSLIASDVEMRTRTIPETSRKAVTNLLAAGGKRLRPLWALYSCGCVGGSPAQALPAASAVELLHTGTLLHDDIIDEAEERRGQPTANQTWGLSLSLLAGDFCFFAAIRSLTETQNMDLVARASEVADELVDGELRQLKFRVKKQMPDLNDCLAVMERKTASVFSFAGYAGARLGQGNSVQVMALQQAGHLFGMAFQLQDDILDLTGESDLTGKSLAKDLEEGQMTLPVVLALAQQPQLKEIVWEILRSGQIAETKTGEHIAQKIEALRSAVCSSSAIETCGDYVNRWSTEAVAALHRLAPSNYRDALEAQIRTAQGRRY